MSHQCQVSGRSPEDIEGFEVEGGRKGIVFSDQVFRSQSAKVYVALLLHRRFGCDHAKSCCVSVLFELPQTSASAVRRDEQRFVLPLEQFR